MKRGIWLFVLALTLILAITAPALAVVFSGIVTLQVSTNTTYSYYPAYINMDNSFLAAHYFTSASLLDVDVKDTGNTSLAMMPTEDKTWFVPASLPANSITSFIWSSGNTAKTSHPIIVGTGGYVTTADAAKLEPDDNFSLIISWYSPGTGSGDIFKKLNALHLSYSGTTLTLKAGNDSTPDETLTATGIVAGVHIIQVSTTYPPTLNLTIDSVLKDSASMVAPIPDNANSWLWYPNPYFNYVKLETDN